LVNILSGIPVPVHNKEIGNIYSDDALSWWSEKVRAATQGLAEEF
jgi:hypothetical protein